MPETPQRTDDVRGIVENPPAFPQPIAACDGGIYSVSEKSPDEGGMTLRDYFAAAALQGMCSGQLWPTYSDGPEMASRAFAFADAMLAERAKAEGAQ